MTGLLAIQHVSTWHLGWSFFALVLPPLLLAYHYQGQRHRWLFVVVLLVLVAIGISTMLVDFHNRQVISGLARREGDGDNLVPWVYISAADVWGGVVEWAVIVGCSTLLTAVVWIGF